MSIRSTAKAIIVHEGKVLLNKCSERNNGDYYGLPGGGQWDTELLEEAIVRECLEETGYRVKPDAFVALYEEICDDEDFKIKYPAYVHKVYHIFRCSLESDTCEGATEADSVQVGTVWMPIEEIKHVRLLPKPVGEHICELVYGEHPLFLGPDHIEYEHG